MKKSPYVALALSIVALVWLRAPVRPAAHPEPAAPPSVTTAVVPDVSPANQVALPHASRDASPPTVVRSDEVKRAAPPRTDSVPPPLALEERVPSPQVESRTDAAPLPLSGAPEGVRKLLLWAAADPSAATEWADQRPDPRQRREALQIVCLKIAEQDPRAALDMAETFGLADAQELLENLIAQWAAIDPDMALAWASRRPASAERDALIARVAFVLSASQPAAAAVLIESSLSPGTAQAADAVSALIQRWSLQDPAAAAAWAVSLPSGPLRERARAQLAGLNSTSH